MTEWEIQTLKRIKELEEVLEGYVEDGLRSNNGEEIKSVEDLVEAYNDQDIDNSGGELTTDLYEELARHCELSMLYKGIKGLPS